VHIVVPEGLAYSEGEPPLALSDFYEAVLNTVAAEASPGETVYLAGGNAFGADVREHVLAAAYLRAIAPALDVRVAEVPPAAGYIDTVDNAISLRTWTKRKGWWPVGAVRLYCTRAHGLRSWLCFRLAGFAVRELRRCQPTVRRKRMVRRLFYYALPPVHVVYETGAVLYSLAKLIVKTLVPGCRDKGDQRFRANVNAPG